MKGEIRMSTALKCDRCHNYFDYDPSAKFNFIAFGHKDIIIGKNFPVKDICPDCMEQFMTWFENPDNNDEEFLKASEGIKTYAEYKDPCKSCHNGKCEQCVYGYCSEEEKKNRWLGNHKKNVGDDDERVNNLYKEAEEISNNAGDTKEEGE